MKGSCDTNIILGDKQERIEAYNKLKDEAEEVVLLPMVHSEIKEGYTDGRDVETKLEEVKILGNLNPDVEARKQVKSCLRKMKTKLWRWGESPEYRGNDCSEKLPGDKDREIMYELALWNGEEKGYVFLTDDSDFLHYRTQIEETIGVKPESSLEFLNEPVR